MLNIPLNDTLAEEHYENVKNKLVTRIETVLKDKICGSMYKVNAKCEIYLRALIKTPDKGKTYPKLEELITAKPDKLISIICKTKLDHPELFNNPQKKNKIDWSEFNRVIYNIFIDTAYKNLEKKTFIQNIGLDTCPYCNRSYTYTIEDGTVKPQIDHFFPKSLYPFLGMSYYNLIPSCPGCNGLQVKGETDPLEFNDPTDNAKVTREKLENPYRSKTENFKFSYNLRSPYLLAKNYIEVELKVPNDDIFKLEELYKLHSDHVEELIQRSKLKYPNSYREMLEKQFKTSSITTNLSLFYRVLIGNYIYDHELHKRPLSKLYRDIALQLEIITEKDLIP